MRVYSYVQKGISHGADPCEDAVLLGKCVNCGGYVEQELPEFFLIGVADGVGGRPAGEWASGQTLLRLGCLDAEKLTLEGLREAIQDVNQNVRNTEAGAFGMATTLAVFGRCLDGWFACWLGNSRIYQATETNGKLRVKQMTTDHNQGSEWRQDTSLDSETLSVMLMTPEAGYLTAYVGMDPQRLHSKLFFLREADIAGGSRYFLTSDGIHDHIPENMLAELMESDLPPNELLSKMIELALEFGSEDDLSIVMAVTE